MAQQTEEQDLNDYYNYKAQPSEIPPVPGKGKDKNDEEYQNAYRRWVYGNLTPYEFNALPADEKTEFGFFYPNEVKKFRALINRIDNRRAEKRAREEHEETVGMETEEQTEPEATTSTGETPVKRKKKQEEYDTGLIVWELADLMKELEFSPEKFVEEFEYEGFNPKYILKRLKEAEKDDKTRKYDILLMVALNILRGNHIDNMERTMKDIAREKVERLRRVYTLSNSVGKSRKTAITLSRVAAVFPYLSCSMMTHISGGVTSREMMRGLYTDFPDHMRHPTFAAMIPTGQESWKKQLMYAHALSQVRFSEIVNRKKGLSQKPLASYVPDTLKYSEISRNAAFVPEPLKIKFLKDWKLITETSPGIYSCSSLVVTLSDRFISEFNIQQ